MSAAISQSALTQALSAIAAAARAPAPERPARVAAALHPWVADPALLAGQSCPPAAERYMRYLLAEDARGAYAVAALVWRPGQMSRVHSHHTWCALGVHAGILTETMYTPGADEAEAPEPCASALRRPGDVSHGVADPGLIHRVANLGTRDAISIHVYGVRFEHFSTSVNRILAA